MFDTSSLCKRVAKGSASVALALAAAACATPEAPAERVSQPAVPETLSRERAAAREAERAKLAIEARALVAQAETDVQRARAKRALWLAAWEDLIAAREALGGNDYARAITRAKHASELAELGLEQLAYPAVK